MSAHARVGFLGPSGRSYDDVHASVDERMHVRLGHGGDREVDGDLGTEYGLRGNRVARVELGDNLHIGGSAHRCNDR